MKSERLHGDDDDDCMTTACPLPSPFLDHFSLLIPAYLMQLDSYPMLHSGHAKLHTRDSPLESRTYLPHSLP